MNNNKVKWNIKDVIMLLIGKYGFIVIVSLLFLRTIKQNPYIGAFFLGIFVIIWITILLRRRNESWTSLGFIKKDSKKFISKGILIGILLFFIIKLIFYPSSYIELFKRHLTFWDIAKCFFILITFKGFILVIFNPLIEEIVYRGLLYQALLNKFSRLTSIIIISGVGTLSHVDSFQNYKWLLIRFITFLCITWLFDKYKNIFICISCHATLNYLPWVVKIISGT